MVYITLVFGLAGGAGNCAVTNYFYDSVLRFFAAILSLLNCSFMPRNSHHVRQSWQTTKASFHNGSVIVLRGHSKTTLPNFFLNFDHLSPFKWTIVEIFHLTYLGPSSTHPLFMWLCLDFLLKTYILTSPCHRSLWMPFTL